MPILITRKVQGCKQSEEMEKDKDRRSYTEAYQTHEDCGYGYKAKCCYDDKYSKYTCIYRRENAVYKFMEKMLEEVEYCNNKKRSHTQLDSRKQVIAFQDRVITINIKEAQHPLK